MDIRIGHGDGEALDMNDDHMSVGRAYVVLNDQTGFDARCCRGEAGMIEFQFRGAVDPGHEGEHQGAVRRRQIIGGGAIQCFFGQSRLQGVETLVNIHYQPMQAVRSLMPGRHHG